MVQCLPPQFESCQSCCGFYTACGAGAGLEFFCCYGCERPDCCVVCCSGFAMMCSAYYIYGAVVACIVGCRMMGVLM